MTDGEGWHTLGFMHAESAAAFEAAFTKKVFAGEGEAERREKISVQRTANLAQIRPEAVGGGTPLQGQHFQQSEMFVHIAYKGLSVGDEALLEHALHEVQQGLVTGAIPDGR